MTTLLTLTLATVLAAEPPFDLRNREPNQFAPSLPELTDAEEEQLDKIIDRFIEFDLGLLKGDDAKKAKADFDKLGPEATFALIRGLNRAAAIDGSCPALVISRKLDKIFQSSTDPELLQFAYENVGSGVKQSRHMGMLKDLKFSISQRKGALARAGITKFVPGSTPEPPKTTFKPLNSYSDADLAVIAGSERGPRLRRILNELGTRKSTEALNALGSAAGSLGSDEDLLKTAREALVANLTLQGPDIVKERLKDFRVEIRVAAASVAGSRTLTSLGGDLVELLTDEEVRVRDAARQALVNLAKGTDYGPAADATEAERDAAVKKWREWWARQGKR